MSSKATVQIYRSNRTEALCGALCERLAKPVGGPFEPEVVVVQGRGMATWLNMELARRHGVSAHTEFIYPRGFVQQALSAVLGEAAVEHAALSEERMLWAVQAALTETLLDEKPFARLRRYLSDDGKGLKRYQLAHRIATGFDQYLTYRPEMIRAWERGDDDGVPATQLWQPMLWRTLAKGLSGQHPAALEEAFLAAAASGAAQLDLPSRVSIFGISSLPPLYVRVVGALARHIDIHMYLFSPSPDDWWSATPDGDGSDEGGNPLVATMAGLGVDFHHVLHTELDQLGVQIAEHSLYAPPDCPGMLGRLQRNVYQLTPDPSATSSSGETERSTIDGADGSIAIHGCHSPMREVEVLHDQLLDLLTRKGATLEPHQIVVMLPDVETYAPLVEAVFDRDIGTEQYVPYRISDRSVRSDSPVIEAFQRLLALVGSRLTATQVLDLLAQSAIVRRFDLDPSDVEQLTQWVLDSGVRWGRDEAHRVEHDQPEEQQNTWRFGLDRLLLGYGMPTGGLHTFAGVLPYDELEGKEVQVLGQLAALTHALFTELQQLEAPRPLEQWQEALARLLETMVHKDGRNSWQHDKIRQAIESLTREAAAAGFTTDVDLVVVSALLDRSLDTAHTERGFLANGVTVCAMVPMRTIPFSVVCMVGMHDQAFPRSARPVDFDLIANGHDGPRPGDRDRRKDDRYIFLEALMAARERLLITYTGQSIRDNSDRPASVTVSELFDCLASTFDPAEPFADETQRLEALWRRLCVRHPLQGFCRSYFDGSDDRLFSYAEVYKQGAEQLTPQRRPIGPFFEQPLVESVRQAGETHVPLAELVRFFRDPVAYLLSRRLDVHLHEDELEIADREPVELGPLEQYQIGATMLDHQLRGVADDRSLALMGASGQLPFGALGRCVHSDLQADVHAIASQVIEWQQSGARDPIAINHLLPGDVRITGELGGLWGQGLLDHRFSKPRAKYLLPLWVQHLVLCWLAPPNQTRQTRLIGRGLKSGEHATTVTWAPVEDGEQRLSELCAIYFAGQSAPLRFTPRSSHKYAVALHDGKPAHWALIKAREEYGGRSGELGLNPHFARVFGADEPPFRQVVSVQPPFDQFDSLAVQVFEPMLRAEVTP